MTVDRFGASANLDVQRAAECIQQRQCVSLKMVALHCCACAWHVLTVMCMQDASAVCGRHMRATVAGAAMADVHVHPGKFPVVQSACMQVRVSRYDSCALL
jgi:hypothetical protein